MELFRVQSVNNPVYREYLTTLGCDPSAIDSIEKIPFLPIEFFKTREVKTGTWEAEAMFRSSGTTTSVRSKNYVRSMTFYRTHSARTFTYFHGHLNQWIVIALLPSYIEQGDSSLVEMASTLIRESGTPLSCFVEGNPADTLKRVQNDRGDRKTLLLGVTYALLDFARSNPMDLSQAVVMETGGMKGRRKEMVRSEVHDELKKSFNLSVVHSEYGMTELMSQAYSKGDGLYRCPPWMRISLRDLNDPFEPSVAGRQGIIRVIDLANFDTCSYIETADLGLLHENGVFEVLGRADNSDVRGCNLLVTAG